MIVVYVGFTLGSHVRTQVRKKKVHNFFKPNLDLNHEIDSYYNSNPNLDHVVVPFKTSPKSPTV
jgi:hypothetical protein